MRNPFNLEGRQQLNTVHNVWQAPFELRGIRFSYSRRGWIDIREAKQAASWSTANTLPSIPLSMSAWKDEKTRSSWRHLNEHRTDRTLTVIRQ
jgi:hypothetical protein